MTNLHDVLHKHVSNRSLPGAVGLVAHGDRLEVAAVGSPDIDGTAPMARDSIFRIASITKAITAAAVMVLVDDVVRAARSITVLTSSPSASRA